MEGIKGSLERLQLDYVDIVYAHRYDSVTPMEEIVRGFTDIIRSGKAFYWGTSMWPAQKITEAYWIARLKNLIPPVVEQPIYNMFSRDIVELEYPPLYEQPYGLGTTIWSPLDSGILTGKYNDEIPTDSRLSDKNRISGWFKLYYEKTKEEKTKVVKALMAYAKEKFNSTVTILALAWTIKNRNVSVCILGGTKPQQLEENMKAIELASKLTKQHLEDIDKILENKPTIDPLRIPLNRLPEKKIKFFANNVFFEFFEGVHIEKIDDWSNCLEKIDSVSKKPSIERKNSFLNAVGKSDGKSQHEKNI